MPNSYQNRVVLIAGPTASGKSVLAVEMARAENGVIINADSMQIYRELRVLTARPSAAEGALAPHRLYGHVSAAENYSVGLWQKQALAVRRMQLGSGRGIATCQFAMQVTRKTAPMFAHFRFNLRHFSQAFEKRHEI